MKDSELPLKAAFSKFAPPGKSNFKSFEDLKDRVGIKEPIIQLSKRIHEEIIGNTRLSIFIRK